VKHKSFGHRLMAPQHNILQSAEFAEPIYLFGNVFGCVPETLQDVTGIVDATVEAPDVRLVEHCRVKRWK
jgi:hypothetical protein